MEKLTNNLSVIQDVLVDVEQRELNNVWVGCWLDHLKDTSYDMEDVFADWNIAMMKFEIHDRLEEREMNYNKVPMPSQLLAWEESRKLLLHNLPTMIMR
ncbi:NB-ARC domain-containing disease resistance protein [Melia azedarach]|uniref:NB-ARC domain-containing disease resistance protein n=1 Tax=Melia azedarach TaxID=155640 RepID=A0ACC1Y5T0_MELAZ|nr:NB-ARC domain-containing disease resistance protein [Melia azedarach]